MNKRTGTSGSGITFPVIFAQDFQKPGMFSVEYFNRIVLISNYNPRINFFVAERLRKLSFQALKQNCTKVIVSFEGVNKIDPGAIEILKQISSFLEHAGIKFILTEITKDCLLKCANSDFRDVLCILNPEDIKELSVSVTD